MSNNFPQCVRCKSTKNSGDFMCYECFINLTAKYSLAPSDSKGN